MTKVCLFLFALVGTASLASAQTPAVDVRTAFGASNYLHGDIEYIAPTLLVAVRFGGETVAIEPEAVVAWQTETETFSPASGPVTQKSGHRFQSVGVNLLRRWNGRVAPFVGGGVGLYAEHRTFESSFNGFKTSSTFGPRAGAQAIGGIDVRVAPRVRAFGQVRFEVRSFADPGGGSVVQGLGGIAIGLW